MSAAPDQPRRRYAARLPREERREQLLDAALRVLNRDGYDGLSTASITAEAGVTRPVLYSAFASVEELLVALLDRSQERALAGVRRALPADPDLSDPDAFLVQAIADLLDAVAADPDVWRPVLGVTRNAPQVVQDRIDADKEAIRAVLAQLVAVGIELRGGPDIDPQVLSHLLVAAAEHMARLVLSDDPPFTAAQMTATVGGILAATRPDGGTPHP